MLAENDHWAVDVLGCVVVNFAGNAIVLHGLRLPFVKPGVALPGDAFVF
jgi:hypothetical protein